MERLTEWFDDRICKGVLVKEECGEQLIKTIFEENDEGYRGMCTLKAYEDTGLTTEQIIEMKERDTAKEPIKDTGSGVRYTDDYICPNCGRHITGTGIAAFCYHCGQRIKWED